MICGSIVRIVHICWLFKGRILALFSPLKGPMGGLLRFARGRSAEVFEESYYAKVQREVCKRLRRGLDLESTRGARSDADMGAIPRLTWLETVLWWLG